MSTRHLQGRGALAAILAVAVLMTGACKPETSAQGTPSAPAPPKATATKPVSNGLAAKSPQVILAAVGKALRGAKSVRMKGTTKDGRDLVALDMALTQQGGRGKMRGPIEGKMVSMQIVAAEGKIYLRSPQLWRALGGAAVAQRIGNNWVAAPAGGAPDKGFLSLSAFAKEGLKPEGRVVKGKPARVAGQPVISLIDSSDRSVLYIAATGKPYPLRMAEAGGRHHVDFTGYDAPVTITRPSNVVDLTEVMGG